jgi:hypothetical protein
LEEAQGAGDRVVDEVFLMDPIDMGIALEDAAGAGPEHQDIEGGLGELQAEFVEKGGGDERVPDSGEGDHQDFCRGGVGLRGTAVGAGGQLRHWIPGAAFHREVIRSGKMVGRSGRPGGPALPEEVGMGEPGD